MIDFSKVILLFTISVLFFSIGNSLIKIDKLKVNINHKAVNCYSMID